MNLKERIMRDKNLILKTIAETGYCFLGHNNKIYKISSRKDLESLIKNENKH